MNSIQLFQFNDHPVRVIIDEDDGREWFVAKDVAGVLGLSNVRTSLALLDDDEKGVHTVDTPGGPQLMTCINEPGVFSFILRSRKDEAREFKRWLTHDVLPQIRRTGKYSSLERELYERFDIPRTLPDALELAASFARQCEEAQFRATIAEAQAAELAPKAALWDSAGSPDDLFKASDVCKILCNDPSITIGRNRLMEWLRKKNWITSWNEPKQWTVEQGLMAVKRPTSTRRNGKEKIHALPLFTVKGIERLHVALGGVSSTALQTSLDLDI